MKTLATWLLIVLVLSVYPLEGTGDGVPFADKLFHFIIYGITCLLFITVLRGPLTAKGMVFQGVIVTSVALSAGYGLLMEVIQSFTTTRDFSIWDAVVNTLGAAAAALFIMQRGSGPSGKRGQRPRRPANGPEREGSGPGGKRGQRPRRIGRQ